MGREVFKKSADKMAMVNIAEVFPGKARILVADDNSDLRLTLCEYLESHNFIVTPARDGSEAINILQSPRSNFEIVFTDLVMAPGSQSSDIVQYIDIVIFDRPVRLVRVKTMFTSPCGIANIPTL